MAQFGTRLSGFFTKGGSSTSLGITSLNNLTVDTQTFATGTTGVDFNINSVSPTHTFNIPTASSLNRGALATTDWTRFANFQILTAYQSLGSSFKSILMSNPSINQLTQANALVSTLLRLVSVYVPIAQTITGVKFFSAANSSFTSSGFNGLALFSYSAGTLTRIAITNDAESNWESFAINTWGNVAFINPISVSEGIYWVAALYNGTGTAPSVLGSANSNTANVNIGDFTNSAKLTLTLSGQTTMPSSVSMSGAGVAASANNPGYFLY